jgi:transposase
MAYPMAMDTHPILPQQLWNQTPFEVQVYIRALEARLESLEALEAKVHTLQEQVRTLEEQLKQTSRNSSRPPSSDPPQALRPKRPRSGRRRGGQPGHRGQTRTLIPVEDVNEVVPIKPEQCASCHAPLLGDDPAPFRHQVIEIPPIEPVIPEYQWHQLVCPDCGETTRSLACGCSQWDFWPPPPCHGSAVYRVISLGQAHDSAGDGGAVRGADECRLD